MLNLYIILDGPRNNLLTSLGSGSDSEEDEEETPMFGEGGDDDFYEQLVILMVLNKKYCIKYVCFLLHRKLMPTMKKH